MSSCRCSSTAVIMAGAVAASGGVRVGAAGSRGARRACRCSRGGRAPAATLAVSGALDDRRAPPRAVGRRDDRDRPGRGALLGGACRSGTPRPGDRRRGGGRRDRRGRPTAQRRALLGADARARAARRDPAADRRGASARGTPTCALLMERLELAEHTREQEAERRAEQERLRIARELHDVIAHTLTTINVKRRPRPAARPQSRAHARGRPGDRSKTQPRRDRRTRGNPRGPSRDRCRRRAAAPRAGVDDVSELVWRTHATTASMSASTVVGDTAPRLPEAVVARGLPHRPRVPDQCPPARRRGSAVQVTLAFEPATSRRDDRERSGHARAHQRARAPASASSGMTRTSDGGRRDRHRPSARRAGFRVEAGLPYARS